YYVQHVNSLMRNLASDTTAADTIPLKLVVYLGLLAAVLILAAQAWHTVNPVMEEAQIKAQVEAASLSICSIQEGYARDSAESHSPEGTMCILKFSFPTSVRYISFGVDPDPECNGQLHDSEWVLEKNTIIYQYKNGVKKRLFLEGKTVHFIKGEQNSEGTWMPSGSQDNSLTPFFFEKTGVVIEYPVSGEFFLELVTQNGIRYTMSHF
ncbi:MAG TPA: hypothetical protein VN414_12225, partial [Methanosarcina sp.]|nr:hypothetical protein [Methanosarcina sp.]